MNEGAALAKRRPFCLNRIMDGQAAQQFTLGQQLLQAGQAASALTVFSGLARVYPRYPELLLACALAERAQAHWPEAIGWMRRALALAPGEVRLLEQLAAMLLYSNVSRNLREAVGVYTSILKAEPQHAAVATNLVTLALRHDMPREVIAAIAPLLERGVAAQETALHCAAACAVSAWLLGDLVASERYGAIALSHRAAAFDAQGKPRAHDCYFMFLYAQFIADLLAYRAAHPQYYEAAAHLPALHIIGESHSLTPAHAVWQIDGRPRRVESHLIMGAKAYFLAQSGSYWQESLADIIRQVPRDAAIVTCFGEIDCRPREGIMEQWRRDPVYPMGQAIDALCDGYVAQVARAQRKRKAPTYILGVPAPSIAARCDLAAGEEEPFTRMIQQFNDSLARAAGTQKLGFIDLYAATLGENGWAREGVHLDPVHLKPEVVLSATSVC
jgi:hypothetical protein